MPILGVVASSKSGRLSDMVLIATNTLSSASPSVTFSNLNTSASAYQHLRLVVSARANTNNTAQSITIELNGSTAANYSAHSFYAFVSSNVVANTWIYSSVGSDNAFIGGAEGLTAYPNAWQPTVYEFPNFSSTDKNKYVLSTNGIALTDTSGSGGGSTAFNNVMWNSTAALTSIKLSLATNFATGSRFSLYGLKG